MVTECCAICDKGFAYFGPADARNDMIEHLLHHIHHDFKRKTLDEVCRAEEEERKEPQYSQQSN